MISYFLSTEMNKDLIWLMIGSVLDNWSSDSIYFVYSHYSFLIATPLDIMSLSTKKDIDHMVLNLGRCVKLGFLAMINH